MRIPVLLSLMPIAVLAAPQTPVPGLRAAQKAILEAFDEGRPLPRVRVRPADRLQVAWLESACGPGRPANPFPRGTKAWKEAQALLALSGPAATGGDLLGAVRALPLQCLGTQVAFWTWGRDRTRRGEMPREVREAWEDRLLEPSGHPLLVEYALRHALCMALDADDDARFSSLRNRFDELVPELFLDFQRAFNLLGGHLPPLRLWTLPGLVVGDPLFPLGGEREIRIQPLEGDALPLFPEGTVWIIPTREGGQSLRVADLSGAILEEALGIASRLKAASRTAYLAASRPALESFGLTFVPAIIRLDGKGDVTRITMGDPARITPVPRSGAGR